MSFFYLIAMRFLSTNNGVYFKKWFLPPELHQRCGVGGEASPLVPSE